ESERSSGDELDVPSPSRTAPLRPDPGGGAANGDAASRASDAIQAASPDSPIFWDREEDAGHSPQSDAAPGTPPEPGEPRAARAASPGQAAEASRAPPGSPSQEGSGTPPWPLGEASSASADGANSEQSTGEEPSGSPGAAGAAPPRWEAKDGGDWAEAARREAEARSGLQLVETLKAENEQLKLELEKARAELKLVKADDDGSKPSGGESPGAGAGERAGGPPDKPEAHRAVEMTALEESAMRELEDVQGDLRSELIKMWEAEMNSRIRDMDQCMAFQARLKDSLWQVERRGREERREHERLLERRLRDYQARWSDEMRPLHEEVLRLRSGARRAEERAARARARGATAAFAEVPQGSPSQERRASSEACARASPEEQPAPLREAPRARRVAFEIDDPPASDEGGDLSAPAQDCAPPFPCPADQRGAAGGAAGQALARWASPGGSGLPGAPAAALPPAAPGRTGDALAALAASSPPTAAARSPAQPPAQAAWPEAPPRTASPGGAGTPPGGGRSRPLVVQFQVPVVQLEAERAGLRSASPPQAPPPLLAPSLGSPGSLGTAAAPPRSASPAQPPVCPGGPGWPSFDWSQRSASPSAAQRSAAPAGG
ncbi:unnamed protein product, partial [Prorocentrum cordatum]